jgi:hypothetical protein
MTNLLNRIMRGLQKPPRVILVRGAQEMTLIFREKTGRWERITHQANSFWTPQKAAELRRKTPWALFDPEGPATLKKAAKGGLIDAAAMLKRAEDVQNRSFSILGATMPADGLMPWLSDWRFDYEWPAGPARHFNHITKRNRPYDVKYPWELSRLHFLLPLLLGAVLDQRADLVASAEAYLVEWQDANPLGKTINWAPMETSMRVISLVLALDFLRAAGATVAVQARFLSALHQSLAFVWSTIEDTDIRGNHFTANLAALMLGGQAISAVWPRAQRYVNYAETRLEKEVLLQYTSDGVNFEKSFSYHRLVSELFLLICISRRKGGATTQKVVNERLRAAATFTDWLGGPDGYVPVWGDSDDAEIFTFDAVDVTDHRSFLSLAGTVLDDRVPQALPSTLLLTGRYPAAPPTPNLGGKYFPEGGYFIARENNVQFVADLGEVGMRGRGGHGHNDILSFALWLHGQAVIVDPGSYIYTGDLTARDRFRGSAAHNGLVLDGVEIARLGPQPFRIQDDAKPLPAVVRTVGVGIWSLEGGHIGYRRLKDPATHMRRFDLDAGMGTLEITDKLDMAGAHKVQRYLQFAPEIQVEILSETSLRVSFAKQSLKIYWQLGTTARLNTSPVSRSYAQSKDAPRLCLDTAVHGNTELKMSLEWKPDA